ncbi:MAG: hypothetical protein V1659_05750 [Candidatus Woesearchaeota archaeon]
MAEPQSTSATEEAKPRRLICLAYAPVKTESGETKRVLYISSPHVPAKSPALVAEGVDILVRPGELPDEKITDPNFAPVANAVMVQMTGKSSAGQSYMVSYWHIDKAQAEEILRNPVAIFYSSEIHKADGQETETAEAVHTDYEQL